MDPNSVDRYIDRVRAIPKLSREDEYALAVRACAGDQDAMHKLVEANLRYVVAIALSYRRYSIKLADLIAEGNVGLVTAVKKFDPELGNRFVTYAGYWIRAFILEAVVRSNTMVSPGAGPFRSKIYFRLRRERAKVANLTQDPDERLRLLAGRFDTSPTKMAALLTRLDNKEASLDVPIADGSGTTFVDTLVSEAPLQDAVVDRSNRQSGIASKLKGALGVLDDRERLIVEERMLADESTSLAALGRKLGVSRERARQLEARAKKKLAQELREFAPAA